MRRRNLLTASSFSRSCSDVVQYTIVPPGRSSAPAQRRSTSISSVFLLSFDASRSASILLFCPPKACARASVHGGSTKILSKGPNRCSARGTFSEASPLVTVTGPPFASSSDGRNDESIPSSNVLRTLFGSLQTSRPRCWPPGRSSCPASTPTCSSSDCSGGPPFWGAKSMEAITRALAPGPAQRSRTASPGCRSKACAANAEAPVRKQHGRRGHGLSGLARSAATGRGCAPSSWSMKVAAERKSAALRSSGGSSGQS
mmetsp:Transcript_32182/g.92596  ORF Transcript_32182/g.92596 Transcript_32182/m.92596 type:complete len:258 (+) Transcript_32182:293-1066(+)